MSGTIQSRAATTIKTTAEKEKSGNLTGDHKVKNKTKLTTNNTKRYLAAFDFDYTIVAQNSDTFIRDLLPSDKLPKELKGLAEKQGWLTYMGGVFRALRDHGITKRMILDGVKRIPEVPGFVRLLKHLQQKYKIDLIIISDSNTIFINEWLKLHELQNVVKRVFTNIAYFDENDLLIIKPYHHQTECKLSAPNLCKGKILEQFIAEQYQHENIKYDRVIYVGDGNNDICPVTRLRIKDLACARSGYSMEKNLARKNTRIVVLAKLITWNTGYDLLDLLEKHLSTWLKL